MLNWHGSDAVPLPADVQSARPAAANEAAGILGIAVGKSPALAFDAGKFLVHRPPLDSEDFCGLRFVAACLLMDVKNLAPLHSFNSPSALLPPRPASDGQERSEGFL